MSFDSQDNNRGCWLEVVVPDDANDAWTFLDGLEYFWSSQPTLSVVRTNEWLMPCCSKVKIRMMLGGNRIEFELVMLVCAYGPFMVVLVVSD